jgi:hypothetical protein
VLLAVAAQFGCATTVERPVEHGPAPAPAPARTVRQTVTDNGDESIADFYLPLARYGDWVEDARYGNVWVPGDDIVGDDFVPYTTGGGWVSTDVGWVFRTPWDETWGWAVFHYGRWYDNDTYGWVWAPEVVWAPSWVDWRYGGAYVGWVPAAPEGGAAAPDAYTFVETRHLVDPGVSTSRVPDANVSAAYAQTQPSRERSGVPAAYVEAAGIVLQTTHQVVPGPGSIRTQARLAATRLLPGGPRKKKTGDAAGSAATTPQPRAHGGHQRSPK